MTSAKPDFKWEWDAAGYDNEEKLEGSLSAREQFEEYRKEFRAMHGASELEEIAEDFTEPVNLSPELGYGDFGGVLF